MTRGDYFSNLTKTESQFKISFLNFFHFFLHHNTSWYIVVLGRRKNPTLFWASFGKLNFLTAAESAANASEQAKQALRQFLNCSLWFAGDKIISKDLPGCCFETRELTSDNTDFSCGNLRRIEVSSAGQVLLDHHFYLPWPRDTCKRHSWIDGVRLNIYIFL